MNFVKKYALEIILLLVLAGILLVALYETNKEKISSKSQEEPSEVKYTVTFDTNGGSAVSSRSLNVLEEAPKTAKENYLFDGWYCDQSFGKSAIFPMELKANITLYAKWLKTKGNAKYEQTSIKCWNGSKAQTIWQIAPAGFDYDRLTEKGFSFMKITVAYNVCYQKDYDVPLNVGYAGSPRYEIYLYNSQRLGVSKKNQEPSIVYQEKTISVTYNLADFENEQIYLEVDTDNIQNIIHFKDIVVTYECFK